jgi:VanZ family protein
MISDLLRSKWVAIAWTAFIFLLLTMPSAGIPDSGLLKIPYVDKIAHIILFGGFVIFWSYGLSHGRNQESMYKLFRNLFLISVGYGILMEFVQSIFTKRAFEVMDMVADAAGACIAWILLKIRQKNKPLWK